MSIKILFAIFSLITVIGAANAEDNCPGENDLNYFLKYHFTILSLTKYNNSCSQIAKGDFNGDGKIDVSAVLTEEQPTKTYANGKPWYKTYILVLLAGELPYNHSQAVFVRTDGNKPKGFSVSAVKFNNQDDLILDLENYSHTRYRWSNNGFKVIEHYAD